MKKYRFNKHLYSLEPRTETIIHHVKRYLEALNHFNFDDSVLDIGCGNGYGTSILALKTDNAVGIDKDGEAIEYAKEDYPTLKFFCKDFELEQKSYDFFVAFEIIEHLDEKEIDRFVNFFKLRCKKGFILSTPVDAMLEINPCHKTQLYKATLQCLFDSDFELEFKFQDWATGEFNQELKGMIICVGKRKKGTGEQWWNNENEKKM